MLKNDCFKGLLLTVLLWSLLACSNDNDENVLPASVQLSDGAGDWQAIPLPKISRQPVHLNVASVVNSRFKSLNDSQLKKLLIRTQQMVKQYFNIDVVFSPVKTIPINDVFSRLDPQLISERRDEIVDIRQKKCNRPCLQRCQIILTTNKVSSITRSRICCILE